MSFFRGYFASRYTHETPEIVGEEETVLRYMRCPRRKVERVRLLCRRPAHDCKESDSMECRLANQERGNERWRDKLDFILDRRYYIWTYSRHLPALHIHFPCQLCIALISYSIEAAASCTPNTFHWHTASLQRWSSPSLPK